MPMVGKLRQHKPELKRGGGGAMQEEDRSSGTISCLSVEETGAINRCEPVHCLHGGLGCNPEIVGCRGVGFDNRVGSSPAVSKNWIYLKSVENQRLFTFAVWRRFSDSPGGLWISGG